MVRLLLVGSETLPERTVVSIPQWCDCCSKDVRVGKIFASFNPTMVRLLQPSRFLSLSFRGCFNPTMVRLLPVSSQFDFPTLELFQSHNGAIAAPKLQVLLPHL